MELFNVGAIDSSFPDTPLCASDWKGTGTVNTVHSGLSVIANWRGSLLWGLHLRPERFYFSGNRYGIGERPARSQRQREGRGSLLRTPIPETSPPFPWITDWALEKMQDSTTAVNELSGFWSSCVSMGLSHTTILSTVLLGCNLDSKSNSIQRSHEIHRCSPFTMVASKPNPKELGTIRLERCR